MLEAKLFGVNVSVAHLMLAVVMLSDTTAYLVVRMTSLKVRCSFRRFNPGCAVSGRATAVYDPFRNRSAGS